MTHDPAIIEAAARALRKIEDNPNDVPIWGGGHYFTAERVLAAVTPLIRAAALEEAAAMVEQSTLVDYSLLKYFAADIRALKAQP
jgi:hypothetical protein